MGFPAGSDGKESACNSGDPGWIPGLGRFRRRRKWQPTPVFLSGKSHGQRSLVGYSPWGCEKSDTTEEYFSLSLGQQRLPYEIPQGDTQHHKHQKWISHCSGSLRSGRQHRPSLVSFLYLTCRQPPSHPLCPRKAFPVQRGSKPSVSSYRDTNPVMRTLPPAPWPHQINNSSSEDIHKRISILKPQTRRKLGQTYNWQGTCIQNVYSVRKTQHVSSRKKFLMSLKSEHFGREDMLTASEHRQRW